MIFIPNLITLARFALVPLLLVLLQDKQYVFSLAVFFVAGVSDALDGYLAKRFNAVTWLGSLLDPLADKVLLMSSYYMLAYLELIPFWLSVVVIFRDLVIVGGYLILALFYDATNIQPSRISKLNTFLQISFILLVLAALSYNLSIALLISSLAVLVLITSVTSCVDYVVRGSKVSMQMTESDRHR